MKKMFYLFAVAMMIPLMFTSCGKSDEVLVREAGENFLSALIDGDLESAKQYVTPATSEKWGGASQMLSDILTPESKASMQSVAVKIGEVKVTGDTAEAVCAVTIPFFMEDISVLHFKKTDGKWLVNEPGIIVKEVIRESTVAIEPVSISENDSIKKVQDTVNAASKK